MEETNVTMTAEEMQGEPAAKENETRHSDITSEKIQETKALKNELAKLQNHRCRSTRTMI